MTGFVAAEIALDDLNPTQLAQFLRDYLIDRAHASGDIEHREADQPLESFVLDNLELILNPQPGTNFTNPSGQEEDDRLRCEPGELDFALGYNSDGTPRSGNDRIWY